MPVGIFGILAFFMTFEQVINVASYSICTCLCVCLCSELVGTSTNQRSSMKLVMRRKMETSDLPFNCCLLQTVRGECGEVGWVN